MTHAMKAVLLSALVCPGSGHLALKHYRRGGFIIAVVVIALAIVIIDAMRTAQLIADQIINGDIPLDATAITAQVSAAAHAHGNGANIATWVLIACWIMAAIDVYRLGRQQDVAQLRAGDIS